MKIKSVLLGAIVLTTMLGMGYTQARNLDEVKATKVLEVITTASAPPHGFMDPMTTKLEGIMVDVAKGVATHVGVDAVISDVGFAGLIPSLTSGRADVMSAPLFITEARAEAIDFSDPVYEWGEGIVISDKSQKNYKNFQALQGSRVGVLVDSVQFNMIKDMPDTKVTTYKDYATLMTDLRAGRIDLGVVDPPSIVYQINTRKVPGVKLDDTYQPESKWRVGLATQKGNTELLKAVNAALATMKSNGELQAVMDKWGVPELISE